MASAGHSGLLCRAMTPTKASHDVEPAGTPMQCQTKPLHRILVVDDELCIRNLNTTALIRSGYHVDAAEDGGAARKALDTDHYDLLITDQEMPKLSGVELVKQLRSEDINLPVILVSGAMPTEELERHPWLRLAATLLKPYTTDELLATVRKVLHGADTPHEQIAAPPNWQSQPSAADWQRGR